MPTRLGVVPTATIHAELRRRRGLTARLAAMRDRLQAKVVAIDARIAEAGGTPNGAAPLLRGGPRSRSRGGRGGQTLVEALAALLKGKTMRVNEAAKAVRKAGYQTASRNFRTSVGIALGKGPFRRVARGRYTAAGAMGGTPDGTKSRRRGAARHRRAGAPGSRGPRAGSLVSVLGAALKGSTMTVTEAVAAARAAGYKTKATAKSFYHSVAIALARSGRFKRVSRGRYTAK